MSAPLTPRRAGILPPYLLDHVAQAAPEHARQCAQLSRQITAHLRQQRARGLLARADALAADTAPATQALRRRIYDAHQGTALPGTLVRDEGAALAIGGAAWEKTGRIWYRALTGGELAAGADFATFAARTVTVASSDYGPDSAEARAVQQAWHDVGVLA
ncbi:hypothetical protein ASF73_19645 [Xanthomonas sp. Leaf131]|nr:hypothetical protein ASF73_19645 [Xanthomonas sp. Leaf131]